MLLRQPSLQGCLPATHTSFYLAALIERSAELDAHLPQHLMAFDALGEPIQRAAIGRALARRVLAQPIDEAKLIALIEPADAELQAGFFGVVLAHGEVAARGVLGPLLRHWGVNDFFARIDPAKVSASL